MHVNTPCKTPKYMLRERGTSGRVMLLLRCMGIVHLSEGHGPCVPQGSEAVLQLLLAQRAEPHGATDAGAVWLLKQLQIAAGRGHPQVGPLLDMPVAGS